MLGLKEVKGSRGMFRVSGGVSQEHRQLIVFLCRRALFLTDRDIHGLAAPAGHNLCKWGDTLLPLPLRTVKIYMRS